MKNLGPLLIVFTVLVFLGGCAPPPPTFYHSEASLPFFHHSTKTTFELINDGDATNPFHFGVISAKDNDTLSYILIAPSYRGDAVNELGDVNLSYSIPLLPKQVMEFIKILNTSSEKWNDKFGKKDGISYQFIVAREDQIIKESQNVATWYPSLRFYFQNNEQGSLGTLFLGERSLQTVYNFISKSRIIELTNLLYSTVSKK
ncbi:MAG: hypothetical protein P4L35_02000 [Ignavibacteriaceae bacterium]|nr:hypothetical protein [Ignavibacteriaceae bacterium]